MTENFRFKCDHCQQEFKEKEYIEHKEKVKDKAICLNIGCEQNFSSKDELAQHMQVDCQFKKVTCTKCEFFTSISSDAKTHSCFLNYIKGAEQGFHLAF